VPRAVAESFRQGNLGIMDYYRMKNVQADTTFDFGKVPVDPFAAVNYFLVIYSRILSI
jgi:SigmaW regulon antibacterial